MTLSAFNLNRFRQAGLLLLAALATIVAIPASVAAPQPAPIPERWQLDLRPGPLRVIALDTDGKGFRTYFYFVYDVVNNSGEDLQFAPSFELATDEGDLIRSGRNVPEGVVRELQRRLKNPLLMDEINVLGPLLQGEEHGREGLVIWPAEDLEVDEIVLFAKGFSGETRTVKRPDTGKEVILRKTMMIVHETPGDITGFGDSPLTRTEVRWILR